MFEETKEERFLKKHFQEYYKNNFVDSVPEIEKREFGFGVMGRKIADRHVAFNNANEMNSFLREKIPLFLSYSNACYKYPGRRPMSNKELEKADIIYEFDADDLCQIDEVNGKQWFFEEHIEATKKEVFRLLDFLENDFNFTEGISINFSGKAGFHIHLRNKEIQLLNKKSRIELVDYLTGYGIYFDNLGFELEKKLSLPRGKGLWGKRIVTSLKELFETDAKEISKITNMPTQTRKLLKSKKDLLEAIDRGFLISVGPRKDKEFWMNIMNYVVQNEKSPIDRQTSIDMHKIIRVPETLHGDTGMKAQIINIDDLKEYSPFTEAIVFGDDLVRVFVKEAPEFYLKGEKFGPYKEEEVEVPLFCAIFLIGKGAELRKE